MRQVSQSVRQSVSETISDSVSQSVSISVTHSVSQSVSESVNESVSQSISQSVSQSDCHSGCKECCHSCSTSNLHQGFIILVLTVTLSFYFLYFSACIREDGSFNIEYDDGDKEFKVPVSRMRILITVRKSTLFSQISALCKLINQI